MNSLKNLDLRHNSFEFLKMVLDFKEITDAIEQAALLLNSRFTILDASGSSVFSSKTHVSLCDFEQSIGNEKPCRKTWADFINRAYRASRPLNLRCACGCLFCITPLNTSFGNLGAVLLGPFLLNRYSDEDIRNFLTPFWDGNNMEYSPEREKHFQEVRVFDNGEIATGIELVTTLAMHLVAFIEKESQYQDIPVVLESDMPKNLDNKLKMLRSRTLQKQLSPHFLFNTLNTIARLAMLENSPRTEHLAIHLANYLRYVLRKQSRNEMVFLAQEIDCISRYLEIYKYRFSERLEYEIEVDENSKNGIIPFMLLLPIVENSINHGLEPSLKPVKILIKARKYGERIIISISDNGVGFDPDNVTEGIGIKSLKELLRIHFRDSANLEFTSSLGEGTSVLVSFPYKER